MGVTDYFTGSAGTPIQSTSDAPSPYAPPLAAGAAGHATTTHSLTGYAGPATAVMPGLPGAPAPGSGWSQPWTAPPSSGMSTGIKVLIGAAIALGALVIVGILAAIAIPVFLNQRAKAEAAAVHVSMPESAAGLERLHGEVADRVEQELMQPGTPGTHYAAVYGTGGRMVAAIGISTHVMRPGDRDAFLRGAKSGTSFGFVGSFARVDAGKLGGDFECASAGPTGVICLFTDPGAYGVVTVNRDYSAGVTLARQLRESVERRG